MTRIEMPHRTIRKRIPNNVAAIIDAQNSGHTVYLDAHKTPYITVKNPNYAEEMKAWRNRIA